ncbi:uncharacterized protein FA14DRAFT_183881 [Meira miltonrushii]|uniref:Uncharacterized protein n=1 Tax=Meira miltonrushii TaxID=1280837 RepID=A0A316VN85_9BASI|nr:uncharacterized protein FA14DRAFT_183881 [Meira miltonrushii]PWN38528.1 hypothetical protein FA14DRAFT_183881 [Meira miltonrushii]
MQVLFQRTTNILTRSFLLRSSVLMLVSGMNPYENICKELGLAVDHDNLIGDYQDQNVEQTTASAGEGKKGKWKAPPGYFSNAAREQRQFRKVMKDNPSFTEEEVKRTVHTLALNKKPNAGYYKKDAFIERKKKSITKGDPTMNQDVVHVKATKEYENFLKGQRDRQMNRRAALREAKRYLESIDSSLGKSFRVYSDNRKEAWIGRRVDRLKRKDPQLKQSDAYSHVYSQYLRKLERDKITRKQRKAKLARNQEK